MLVRVYVQDIPFQEVKRKLTKTLQELTTYYARNQLTPNPDKTQICCFHLQNCDQKREVKVEWLGKTLKNTGQPV